MENMEFWNKVAKPPSTALKQIGGGRLKGMTDIQPMWRYEALTEQFGACGIGWKFTVERVWTEVGSDGQVVAHALIKLYVINRDSEQYWSDPIPGIGGSMFIAKETKGLYTSDEAYKMAVTDALSTACKMLGIGADIYAGKWDGSKYRETRPSDDKPIFISQDQVIEIEDKIKEVKADKPAFLKYLNVNNVSDIPVTVYKKAIAGLEAKANARH